MRAGWASPRLAPGGLIVLETTGRHSGRVVRTPLAATRIGGHVVVATVRGDRSQWVRNLEAEPSVHYWWGGRRRPAHARVFRRGATRHDDGLPSPLQALPALFEPSLHAGWAFAVLSPLR